MNGSVSFAQNWAEYRDGFGSPAGNDNYWLGLDKIYRLQQLDNLRLRIEVKLQLLKTHIQRHISLQILGYLNMIEVYVKPLSGVR